MIKSMDEQKVQYSLKWWVYGIVALTQVILNFDFTAVNLALPPMAREFFMVLGGGVFIDNSVTS